MAERQDFINAIMLRVEALAVFDEPANGGVHLGVAPDPDDEHEFPYLVVVLQPSLGEDYRTGGPTTLGIWPVLFNVYALTAAAAAGALEDIEADFEGTLLAPATGTCLASFVGSSIVDVDPDKAADGEEVWHATVLIEFQMQRTLT
ncbi:unnamed protein product [marine sediment metagenome]|uniref:DUF3168 domain-containing protein n=1 Tax=marine sediment metagenome TaxID=412755 RepID=X1FBC1_9ZZZZ